MNKIIANVRAFFGQMRNFFRPVVDKARSTHSDRQLISLAICLGIVLLSLVAVLVRPNSVRSVFFFPDSVKQRVGVDVRYLPPVRGRDARLGQFVDELLLGASVPGLDPLFARGTVRKAAFIRGSTAYIDLSVEALSPNRDGVTNERAVSLFKKNVCTNFRNVDTILVYIDGIEAYSKNPLIDAKNEKR
jgi:hypothetical protein